MEQGRKNDRGKKLAHLDASTANASSSTDCTGLIPAAPSTGAEVEAYQEVFGYRASPEDVPKKKKK